METILIDKMKEFAFNKHNSPSESQRYGNQPYSKHLEDVVANVKKYLYYIDEHDHEDLICAAYAHDTLEDTDTSPSNLEKLFNHRIADIVLRVSNERGFTRKERNFRTWPKIWTNDLAIFIKLADRLANTRNSLDTGHKMYEVYKSVYPIFRYAIKVRDLYPDMWS